MGFVPLRIPPGIVKADSKTTAQGRWVDADKVRFVRGLPEKINGWEKTVDETYSGIVRGSTGYSLNNSDEIILFGTACDFYWLNSAGINEVTPWGYGDEDQALAADPFGTTSGLATVDVTHTAHGISEVGLKVSFSGATAVGGITIDGEYTVTSITDANTYVITHTSNATSTATGGGGSVLASYELECGNISTEFATGWGVGGWGEEGWGTPRAFSSTPDELRTWSISQYGEDAIVNPLNGTLYYLDASAGVARPTEISNAPENCRHSFVTEERYIFALGCTNVSGNQDNMTVRWPDIDDYTVWTPTDTNTANERRLQGGSKLLGGSALGRGLALVWSDATVFRFQFTGRSEIYASRKMGDNCGLIAPHAFAVKDEIAYWASKSEFHMYTGFVQSIPNQDDMRDDFFDNLNEAQREKIFVFFNPRYDEIWFCYPRGANIEPSHYWAFDIKSQTWFPGSLARTSFSERNSSDPNPVLFGTDGYLYTHELGYSKNADGAAMEAFIELAPTEIANGNLTHDIMGYVPDMKRQVGDVSLELISYDHPRDSQLDTETVTVEPTDDLVDLRIAGRQIAAKWTSNSLDGDMRLGEFGFEIESGDQKR